MAKIGNPIQVICGGQYGSEAKGTIAAYLAVKERVDIAVRTGATNAGHTVYYKGLNFAMQQLPVAWVNPRTQLVLGPGTLIDPDILAKEIEIVSEATGEDIRNRLVVDYRAFIHRHEHKERSTASGRHHLMGATGKGCSEALMDRIRLRGTEDWTVGGFLDAASVESAEALEILKYPLKVEDTERILNDAWDQGAKIQLEGTQGQLLDLCLGPYPYTTHKQTGPAQWMVEAGLSPSLPTDIVMVVRTMPIRVAGNSGPLPNEVSWPEVARGINMVRTSQDLQPVVADHAIADFEQAVRKVTVDNWLGKVPYYSNGLDQHRWSPAERLHYREAASEIHKQALEMLPADTVAELRKVFEVTTVTRKLRRIAKLSSEELSKSARQMRPDRVAVTFMNYTFPARWGSREELTAIERGWLEVNIGSFTGAKVFLVNRGPLPDHLVEVEREEITHG